MEFNFNLFNLFQTKYYQLLAYLYQPCDPKPLVLFRILFGFLMFLDIPQERGLEDADIRFGDPNYCFFPLFQWIQPVNLEIALVLYSFMWAGSIGMMLGFKFRYSCLLFLCPYLYFFLLDKSRWNNHSYLFALFTILLMGSGAGDHLSIDAHSIPTHEKGKGLPRWNYFMLKFQIFILYFFAGIKKLDADWVAGYSMRNLSKHKLFTPIKLLLEPELIEFYLIHLGGLAYDLSVGFMLNIESSKKIGIFLSIAFHGMNSQLFDIGMFPYVCLSSLILFCKGDQFPCNLLPSFGPFEEDQQSRSPSYSKSNSKKFKKPINFTIKQKTTSLLILFYISLQIFMPFSHFITRGYNNWTPGLYGYSWDMMINSWETLHQKITVTNRLTRQQRFLDPDIWVANDRWSSHADMAIQYAHCIERNLGRFNITNVEVNLDILKSLNGRFQQRIYDPRIDILQAPWSPFQPVPWVLPLLTSLSHYRRSHFDPISHSVSNLSSSSDVIFIADFPGLFLENYMPLDLSNISVTILNGEILVEQKGLPNITLSSFSNVNFLPKTSTSILSGEIHKIHTVSSLCPSSYMYTYTNATQLNADLSTKSSSIEEEEDSLKKIGSGLSTFFKEFGTFIETKVEIFTRSLYLVVNAHLNLLFDVPMVIRKNLQ